MQILLHASCLVDNGDRSMCLASRKESYALVDVKCAWHEYADDNSWRAGASQPSRSFERNFLYIYNYIYNYIYICRRRRTSCKCACAASNALLFIRNNFQTFTHFHTRCLSRYAPIDLASPRTLLHSVACAATFGD